MVVCGILLNEDEIDQTKEEPDEIKDINHDRESKFEKSDAHETFELKVFKCYLKNSIKKRYEATSVPQDTLAPSKKTQATKSSTSYF
ncbi:hypothetical protein TNCV_3418561 [Trichonephila clavipes]|nr:hypothetical protein TNCV_3418561 [Trichonephila clavipes]